MKNCTAELHQHPTELMKRLVREWQRWVVGGMARLASRQRGGAERNKRLRFDHNIVQTKFQGGWLALVYSGAPPALRDVAERILREYLAPR